MVIRFRSPWFHLLYALNALILMGSTRPDTYIPGLIIHPEKCLFALFKIIFECVCVRVFVCIYVMHTKLYDAVNISTLALPTRFSMFVFVALIDWSCLLVVFVRLSAHESILGLSTNNLYNTHTHTHTHTSLFACSSPCECSQLIRSCLTILCTLFHDSIWLDLYAYLPHAQRRWWWWRWNWLYNGQREQQSHCNGPLNRMKGAALIWHCVHRSIVDLDFDRIVYIQLNPCANLPFSLFFVLSFVGRTRSITLRQCMQPCH